MGSTRSKIIASVVIILVIVLLVVWRVTVGLSETFYLLLGAGVAAILAILIWIYLQYRSQILIQKKLLSFGRELRTDYSFLRKVAGVPTKFRYRDLETATDDFRAVIGRGASGTVFKGILDDGTPVAVKRLEGVEHAEKEFKAEVSAIASVHHVNLVRLFGYCRVPEGPHLLVYQFVHNGSLCSWIFPRKEETQAGRDLRTAPFPCLPWDFRYRVAIDVAKALSYLHHDCRSRILHLDVKPENILLDENFRAVVTDFGLSKLMGKDASRIFATFRGTEGYFAPEWLLENGISEKSDIYSYGMVLLEIVGGRRNVRTFMEDGQRKLSYFPKTVAQKAKEGKLMEIVDKRLVPEDGTGDVDVKRVIILVHVALWCIQENPKLRPNMARVVDMLEGRVSVDRPPETPMALVDLLGVDSQQTRRTLDDDGNGPATRQVAATFSFTQDTMSILSGR